MVRWQQALVPAALLAVAGAARAQTPASAAAAPSPASSASAAVEVVVVGEHRQRPDKTAHATVVSRERLRDNPRSTLFEKLAQDSAGVYVTARGAGIHGIGSGATGGLRIRGLGGSPNAQVVVVEDGVPDYQAIFGHPIPDAYVPFLLEEATIVEGGDSVRYGTNAMGGAILLRSRWLEADGWQVENDGAVGSFNTVQESAAALGRSGRWGLAGAIHALRTDGHRPGAGGQTLVGQVAVRAPVGGGFELMLREKAMHLTGSDPGPVTHPYVHHDYEVWRDRLALHATLDTGRISLRIVPFVNVGVHRLYDGFHAKDTVAGAVVESEWRPSQAARVLVGSAYERADGVAENRVQGESIPMREQQSVAWYSEASSELVRGVQAVAGARLVSSATWGQILLYKAGVRWSLGRGWWVRGRVARNFRQPTLNELYLPFPTSHPGLKPERSTGTEVGLGHLSRHVRLSATWYRNDVTNMIRYFGVWPSAEVVNIDRTAVVGAEAQAALREVGPLGVRVGIDVQDVGRYTRQNPSARGVAGLDATVPVSQWILGASLQAEWVHGLYMGNYARDRLSDITVLDAGLRASHTDGERALTIEPYLMLRNLLDSRYAYVAGYTMPGFHSLAGLRLVL